MLVQIGIALISAVLGLISTGIARSALERFGVMDMPNERSNHFWPTPRGAGLALLPCVLLIWSVLSLAGIVFTTAGDMGVLIAVTVGLGVVSWIDDIKGVPVLSRLAVHLVSISSALIMLPAADLYFQGWLPANVDLVLSILVLLWFVNLFNFMDGIDGITGVEAISIGLGSALVDALSPVQTGIGLLGLAVAGGYLGFLRWNWQPAKIFLGDVGSITTGFLLGWLLLRLAAEGHWAAAIILPLYYLGDASVTLLRRLSRRDAVWRAHKSHFYQRAVAAGLSHARVSLMVAGLNLLLIGLAVWSLRQPWLSLLIACVAVSGFLIFLNSRRAENTG